MPMGIIWKLCWVLIILLTFFLFCYLDFVTGQPYDYPIANLSTSWINSVSAPHSVNFTDGSTVRALLLRGTFGPKFACGFFCNGNCDTYLFAIFIVQTNSISFITSPAIGFPQVVWSANRNNPVRINSTLHLTTDGDLVLKEDNGTVAWSTNTAGRSVAGLNLTDTGNLVLFDHKNSVVWQSFDHPTDSLVPGQKLSAGQKLTASVSATNWTQGLLYLTVTGDGLFAFIESEPPQSYYEKIFNGMKNSKEKSYVRYLNGSLALFILSAEPNEPDEALYVPPASSAQYMKLGPGGHLRVYEWKGSWTEVADLLTERLGSCTYPMVCGQNGICSHLGICSCPTNSGGTNYFIPPNYQQPEFGCAAITPLTCEASQYHKLIELEDVTYFTFSSDIDNTDAESCRQACLNNCSCKAAIFRSSLGSSSGDCYLPSEVFSLMTNVKETTHYNSSASIKVQIAPSAAPTPAPNGKKKSPIAIILGSIGGAVFLLFLTITVLVYWKKKHGDEDEEDYIGQVPGMLARFPYEQLKAATDDFSKKLGEGGFGSVYEGTLKDSVKVAVKCLDGLGQVKKSFLAEVETIGSIHHVNLVRLIGVCAEKSHRVLVYEYMSNGSLDKWIYRRYQQPPLEWKCRRKIVHDVAKGLAYLHEDCRQKIIHLDIKPQNILLDENFNAKVADFGLSKLIDRDQSQVMTTMRGTPGYIAPEWLSSVITEKVDVYSFGIVVLEIMCGRKNVDRSEPEEAMHLLSLFKQKVEEGQLLDMIDKHGEDMQLHRAEVVEMMRVAAWCLQSDFSKRPSMSVVVKVLEGVMDVEHNLDYNFSYTPSSKVDHGTVNLNAATPLLPSVLSGPR